MSAAAIPISLRRPAAAPPRAVRILALALAAGLAAFVYLLVVDRQRLWTDYLADFLFFTGMAQAAVLWSAVTRLCHGRWAAPLHRLTGAAAGVLPLSVLLFVPLMFARRTIFAAWWSAPPAAKLPWLNHGFLLARDVGLLALLAGLSLRWWRHLRQPVMAPPGTLAVGLVFAYCYGYTVLGWDLNMALDVHWYDYLYGWYFFITHWYAGLALVTVLAIAWRRRLDCPDVITLGMLHDNGELTFGFAIFWTYLFWAQYMVLWYANRRDDIEILARLSLNRPWLTLGWITLTLGFILPFAFGLSRAFKRRPATLGVLAGFSLAAMWLEQNLMVNLALWHRPQFPPLLSSAWLSCGFAGAYGLVYLGVLRRVPAFPVHDPVVTEALLIHPPRH